MLTFDRHLTQGEIRAACRARGFLLDTQLYDKAGSDFITFAGRFDGVDVRVVYSSFSGRFLGETRDGVKFDSESAEHDNEPWFAAILSFVYIAKSAA
jgi:hypothetical protein